MGIYDRDYYRSEGPSFLGSFAERGTICKWLIGINVLAFVVQLLTVNRALGADPFTNALLLDAPAVLQGEIWRLLTYAFLHDTGSGAPWHILWNMLFLWWFGKEVEDLYGPREFLAFYLTSAVLAGLAFVGANQMHLNGAYCLGASGAVTAVLLLYAFHYPRQIIYLFFFLPVPIWLFVAFSIAFDTFSLLGNVKNGVAVSAHLGGAVFGALYYKWHWRLTGWLPQLTAWRKRQSQPRLRVYREEPVPTPVSVATPAHAEDEQLEAKMDAILEKISRVGKENLTESERQLLLRASEKFKRRRH
jgi:membrane associated rhomboid family serine protease